MANFLPFTVRQISTVEVPEPFTIVDLTASIAFVVRPGGGSGPSWKIIFEVRPLYPGAATPRGIVMGYAAVCGNGDTWPPRNHISGLGDLFHLRLWQDGRVAAGCFQMVNGIEKFFFGLGRIPVAIHYEDEIMAQRISHRLRSVKLDSWFEATELAVQSKYDLARTVFETADRHRSTT
ncbi:Hypothetical protein D9617_15g043060 [Elsinoe fawcettii]|nr:Hypothetical protein D9617_15g043060 [Elsinoe fawcettii]